MTEKTEISAQQRDVMATIDSFMAVTDEYADKTTKYNMPKIYGGTYLYRDGVYSDPQAEYMEDLRKNMGIFKNCIAKFVLNHPEIPISAEDTYLDGGFKNPNEHHHPAALRIVAAFPDKKNEIAKITVTHGDYRGIPTIKMTFGKKTLYEDRLGQKFEEEETQRRIAKSSENVQEHVNKSKDNPLLDPYPLSKVAEVPIIARFINWLTETKE